MKLLNRDYFSEDDMRYKIGRHIRGNLRNLSNRIIIEMLSELRCRYTNIIMQPFYDLESIKGTLPV